jgi:CHAD domain-containing protein
MARSTQTATVAPTTVREIERKYDARDTFQLPRVSDLTGGTGRSRAAGRPGGRRSEGRADGEKTVLTATYYDTPDLRLLNAGVTLRRRTGGADEGWHLKLPAGQDSRDEVRVPLGPGRQDVRREPPAELVSLVRVHTRGAELAPVAELVTRRRTWRLSDGRDRELAELVDDHVAARTLGAETTTRAWRELEVELAGSGSPHDLDRIERRLLRAGATRSTSSSKLGRLLGGPAARRASRGSGQVSRRAGDVVVSAVRVEVERLRALDPQVRRGEPDAVHQMRVSARRLRALLRGFGRVLDRGRTRAVADELRWLGTELAAERDTEVMTERFTASVHALPDDLVLGPVAADLTRALNRDGADARAASLAALDSPRYLALQEALDRLVADPPLTGRATALSRKELPKSVGAAFRTLDRRLAAAAGAAPGPERDQALHAARKAAKRVRYVTEVTVPVVGKPAERLGNRVKKVQTVLGDHQDAVVAVPALRRLGAAAHTEGLNGFTYGVLLGVEQARAEAARRELPPLWERARAKRATKWLR